MTNKLGFINKAIKQGNSLCVRIPKIIRNQGKIEEGTEIYVEVTPQNFYKFDEESASKLFKISKNIKRLNRYSDEKKRLFIYLNFKFIEKISENGKIKFIESIKEDFGEKMLKEFLDFEEVLNKEAFIHEKDGSLILKKKYRI